MAKKIMILMMTLVFVGMTGSAFAAIDGSAHDLGDDGLGTTEVCKFCHTPHNPDPGSTHAPLWDKTVSSSTFTLYDGSSGTVGGASALCLGCHDGATTIDSFGGAAGTTNMATKFPGSVANLGLDLQDDHPVDVLYPTTGMNPVGGLSVAQVDGNNKVQCSSCHDPHDTTNAPFLRASNANSALCLDCHAK